MPSSVSHISLTAASNVPLQAMNLFSRSKIVTLVTSLPAPPQSPWPIAGDIPREDEADARLRIVALLEAAVRACGGVTIAR